MNNKVHVTIELDVYEDHVFRALRAISSPPPYNRPPKGPNPPGTGPHDEQPADDAALGQTGIVFDATITLPLASAEVDLLHNGGERLKHLQQKLSSAQLLLTVWAQELNNLIQSLPALNETREERC